MDEITITIPGPIVGKQRPKFTTRGGFTRAVTPHKTVNYENLVKMAFQDQIQTGYKPEAMLAVEIFAYYEIPKSTSKKKRVEMEAGRIRPTKKPDADNIAKSILDALNGLAYHDDAQVVQLNVFKFYGEPHAVVKICEL